MHGSKLRDDARNYAVIDLTPALIRNAQLPGVLVADLRRELLDRTLVINQRHAVLGEFERHDQLHSAKHVRSRTAPRSQVPASVGCALWL